MKIMLHGSTAQSMQHRSSKSRLDTWLRHVHGHSQLKASQLLEPNHGSWVGKQTESSHLTTNRA